MTRWLLLLVPALAWGQQVPLTMPQTAPLSAVAIGAQTGQATWFMIRSFQVPPYGGRICIEDRNDAGQWQDTCINPGTMVGTPGHEQGDFDFDYKVDGVNCGISMAGRWKQYPPGLMPQCDNVHWIGSTAGRFVGINLVPVACPRGIPGNPIECVRINGGVSPVYRSE